MSGWWLASYIGLWILVVVLCLVVLALIRQVGALHLRLGPRGALEIDEEGPPLGEAPPPLEAHDLDGRPMVIGGPGRRQFLLFVSPGCPVCREVVPSLPVVARRMTAFLVSDGDPGSTADAYGGAGGASAVVTAPDATREYALPGTPYAVILDESGVTLAKGTVNNMEQVEGLLDTAAGRAERSLSESGAP
jgi:methylamine dehydrogenase accessory protein MauD